MKKYGVLAVALVVTLLMGCQPISQEEKAYQSALQSIDKKSFPEAIGNLSDLGDYKESREMVSKLRYIVNGDYIGAGGFLIAAIKSDGTVTHKGGNEDSASSDSWKDFKTLSTRGEYIEGLDEKGKIATTSPVKVEDFESSTLASAGGMINVINEMPKLEHVSAFQSYYPSGVIALLENGTVQQVGLLWDYKEIAVVKAWKNIVAVTARGSFVVGLLADGSVVATGERMERDEVSNWKDVVAISTDTNTIGLKKDGTVIAAGENRFGECNVEGWTEIIAIATSGHHSVGLKKDGTVIATGDNSYGQGNTADWTDIVAIDASWYYTLGLKSDGTLVIAGDSSSGGTPTPNVANVSGLMVPTIHSND
ncbi:hypothetical protein EHS13_18740 [Paenibacillus psychroresistens]|uniref:Chromosome condensation regulator n=1 Tax=Paenibacillus psychroresistens TaxID=1778678 RepID=A0A6B8RKF8_9BACL|nr:hypothetical protein [Paenibacillus psychroresistens]QGQ96770.1 hypothetical protein EHS13_18740 [Paenibacillus psychroresistens]